MAQIMTDATALSVEDRRTLRVALAYWQAMQRWHPALRDTPSGREEWDRTQRLLD